MFSNIFSRIYTKYIKIKYVKTGCYESLSLSFSNKTHLLQFDIAFQAFEKQVGYVKIYDQSSLVKLKNIIAPFFLPRKRAKMRQGCI